MDRRGFLGALLKAVPVLAIAPIVAIADTKPKKAKGYIFDYGNTITLLPSETFTFQWTSPETSSPPFRYVVLYDSQERIVYFDDKHYTKL